MSSSRPQQRRPRADAQRNYDRLISEAGIAFREQGTDAPLESIARKAGVAIGTLYGHFPNRRNLISAVLRTKHDELFALGDQLLAHHDAMDALMIWIRLVVAHAASYRGLATLLIKDADDEASALNEACRTMNSIGERLLEKARSCDAVRANVTAADVFALINAAAWTREQTSEEQANRLLAIALNGLKA